jgi:hypothetical protein
MRIHRQLPGSKQHTKPLARQQTQPEILSACKQRPMADLVTCADFLSIHTEKEKNEEVSHVAGRLP